MTHEFRLPDVGEGLTEAEIVRWLVPIGDRVEVDQPVVEIETDKAVMEIPSPFAGVVLSHGASEGEVLEVGRVLVVVSDEEGDDAEPPPIVGTISSAAVDLSAPVHAADIDGGVTVTPEPMLWTRRVQTLPQIRKMAKELGVDLYQLEGSGPNGRIIRDDVLKAAGVDGESTDTAMSEPEVVSTATSQVEPLGESMSATRRTIAEHMTRSWREIPHVTTFDEVDATRLLAARKALKERRNAPVSIDAMTVKAVVSALHEHPDMAARLVDGVRLERPGVFDIGVAVDAPIGLLVVVVNDVDGHDLVELTAAISRLANGARNRTLPPSAFSGQSFTVSNIGAVGGGFGTPIIPYGTTAILSVGRAVEKPIARAGRVEIAPMLPLSLSYDHRVVDGAAGRRFLATVMENLQEPTLFLA